MKARPVDPLTDGRGYTDHKKCRLSRRPPEGARWRDQYRAWPIICPRYVPVPVEDRRGCTCAASSELCSRCHLGVGKCMRGLAYAEWALFVSRETLGVAKSLSRITQAVAWGVPCSPAPFVVVAGPAPSLAGTGPRGLFGSPST